MPLQITPATIKEIIRNDMKHLLKGYQGKGDRKQVFFPLTVYIGLMLFFPSGCSYKMSFGGDPNAPRPKMSQVDKALDAQINGIHENKAPENGFHWGW